MMPSNPILHTTRLHSIFEDYHEGAVYERIPLFYEDWDIRSAERLLACDEEVQDICGALPELRLHYVRSLREHYESPTAEAMKNKLRSIPAFRGITTPSVKVAGGYIPDLHSRYFTADFSFGLSIIKQIADFASVPVPHIDATLNWYEKIKVEDNAFRYADYGITNRDSLINFYSR